MKQRKITIKEFLGSEKFDKPDIPDGFEFSDKIKEYLQAINYFKEKNSFFFAIRFPLILSEDFKFNKCIESIYKIIHWFKKSIFSPPLSKKTVDKFPNCDFLIFCSSYKPNVYPGLKNLAKMLAKKGRKTYFMMPQSLHFFSLKGKKIVENDFSYFFHELLKKSFSRFEIIVVLISSLRDTVKLLLILYKKNKILFAKFFVNPFNLCFIIIQSKIRFIFANIFLSQSRPKLIITNGDHLPYAVELVLSPIAKNCHKIWFFNEHPLAGLTPVVSDEVWVWNRTVVESLKEFIPEDGENQKTLFSIVGRAEIDFVLKPQEYRYIVKAQKLEKIFKERPTLLFISEYDGSEVLSTDKITKEALRWIGYVAQKLSNWCFVIKSREYHYNKNLPGEEFVKNLDNVFFGTKEYRLVDYLSLPNISVVAACGSSALFVAAGVGKIALRLFVSRHPSKHKVIDEVSFHISSPEDLFLFLNRLEKRKYPVIIKKANTIFADKNKFPYRGKVLQQMLKLSLARLKKFKLTT